MESKKLTALINQLYEEVHKSGWPSHLWKDEDWSGLYSIREICNNVLPNGFKLLLQEVYGYDANGMAKRYLFTVENSETGERIIDAYVSAFAAGRVGDVWSAYDCTCVFYANKDNL